MATPMLLYPQTNEQRAVARRVREIGAGLELQEDSAGGIRAAVREILSAPAYAKAAQDCGGFYRKCAAYDLKTEQLITKVNLYSEMGT